MELLRPLSTDLYPVQTVSLTTSWAGTANAWPSGAQGVLVWSDAAFYAEVNPSTAPTGTSVGGTPIPANVPVPFYIQDQTSSAPWKVYAKTITGTGTLYCKPINIR